MAIWQYDFNFTPQAGLHLLGGTGDDAHAELNGIWAACPTAGSLFEAFGQVLPEEKSWYGQARQFGSLDGNCCEVFLEAGLVVSARLRIDFQDNFEGLLSWVADFCLLNGIAILDHEDAPVPLNAISLEAAVKNSPQFLGMDSWGK